MPNRYTTREAVKAAAQYSGATFDARIDDAILAASVKIESLTATWFVPKTGTRQFGWPIARATYRTYELPLDAPLLALTAITRQGADAEAMDTTDVLLEPVNYGPPYLWLALDRSSASAYFEAGDTPQRAIRVTGRWGECEDTVAAGELGAAIADASTTSITVADGSRVGVGDHLLIDTEQLIVTDRATVDLGVNTSGSHGAQRSANTLTLAGAPTDAVAVGEVLVIAGERLLVTGVTSTTVFTVERGYDGSVLKAHADDTDVYVERVLTVERGANGTTAATHADATAISRYQVPHDVAALARAEALAALAQDSAAWGREVGTGDGAREFKGSELARMRREVRNTYRRRTLAGVGVGK